MFCRSGSCNSWLHIIFDHWPFAPRHSVTKALKSPTSTSALKQHFVCHSWFLKRQKSHWSLLHFGTGGRRFFQGLLPPWAQRSYWTIVKNKFYWFIIYTWYREKYFSNRKFVTIYVRSTLHKETEFLQERQFWFGPLAFHYGSCFNASLSRYTF